MANVSKERIAEIEKLAKVSTRKIDGYTKDIEKIDVQIKELTAKKKSLTNSIVSERNATVLLNNIISQMENLNAEMSELLYIGLASKYGLPIEPTTVTVDNEKKERAERVFYLDGYKPWATEISIACGKNKQNAVMNRVYNYLRKNYGICFEQEEKEFYEANGRKPKKTKELMYWVEKTKPVHKGLTLTCTHTIVNEMYSK